MPLIRIYVAMNTHARAKKYFQKSIAKHNGVCYTLIVKR